MGFQLGAEGFDCICVVIQGVAAVRQEVHALLARKEHQNWNTIIQVLHINFYNLKGRIFNLTFVELSS